MLMGGRKTEHDEFQRRNRAFMENLPRLVEVANSVFKESPAVSDEKNFIPWLVARQIAGDFDELLTLASFGYGLGALRVLRTIFERAVTSASSNNFSRFCAISSADHTSFLHHVDKPRCTGIANA